MYSDGMKMACTHVAMKTTTRVDRGKIMIREAQSAPRIKSQMNDRLRTEEGNEETLSRVDVYFLAASSALSCMITGTGVGSTPLSIAR